MSTPNEILLTWKNSLSLTEEEVNDKGEVTKEGLRIPQLGAYHRVLSHWSLTPDHSIIVLPTGVGKTDTMITIMIGALCEKTLIIVPSKALRNQIAARIRSLGILTRYKLITDSAKQPIVITQKKKFKSLDEIDKVCESANVIISTASLFTSFPEGHLERLSANCTHLFLDEAHHSQAPETWAKIQRAFKSKPALLFTATPFRNDERFLHGEIIYNYPLSKAQKENYFTKIEQHPISEYDPDLADEAIADKAIALLESDLQVFPKHLIMARVNSIKKAEKIFELYKRKYSKYNPVLVHSNISEKKKKANQTLFESGESKIAICVDMFGEGYDLPEIKIGAFHDMRKNITTALQLIGRFTRLRKDLGTAKFVYNLADENSPKEILKLIGDDTDWNVLIPNLSEGKTQKQQDLDKFVKSFELPNKLPLRNLKPAFSVVVYSSQGQDWSPSNYKSFFRDDDFVSIKDLSNKENTIVIVAAEKVPLDWIRGSEYFNVEHHLYIVHWIKEKKLLFIHSSKTGSNYYKELARALLGDDFSLVNGEKVYRSLHLVERIKFHGVGLTEPFGKDVSYVHRNGSNVVPGISVTDLFNRSKRVLQGTGYKNGDFVNFGMTSKGRVWSFRRENINELIRWGRELAGYLVDSNISTSQLVNHVALPKIISERPNLRPFTIEWPDIVYQEALSFKLFDEKDRHFHFYDCPLQLHEPSSSGDIFFKIMAGGLTCLFCLKIDGEKFEIVQKSGPRLFQDSKKKSLIDWLNENPPSIFFVDGSFLLDGNQYTELGQSLRRYDINRLAAIDWIVNGVDIKSESEGMDRSNSKSIQYYLIDELVKKNYNIVFNDDNKDETADIITILVDDPAHQVQIELYHCKYSQESTPGCRLKDLYEVLGQSQKNMRWIDDNSRFIEQLVSREQKANAKELSMTRLRKGSISDLKVIGKKVRHDYSVSLKVYAVQPGLSKRKFEEKAEGSNEVERLFAVTEDYIKATKRGEFYIICSP